MALTSITWREAWKYGERAFRYCNHDVGHAQHAFEHVTRFGTDDLVVFGFGQDVNQRVAGLGQSGGAKW